MDSVLAEQVGRELAGNLADALQVIEHCLAQLNDEQVWWRPNESMNSIGNLLLHLAGNVRQWIIAGLGSTPDQRNRPAEFAERRGIAKAELRARLSATVEEARDVLTRQTTEDWLRRRQIQGFDESGLGAALNSVAHFRGHTQEIVHLARILLGERYRFAWAPATPEEGAPGEPAA